MNHGTAITNVTFHIRLWQMHFDIFICNDLLNVICLYDHLGAMKINNLLCRYTFPICDSQMFRWENVMKFLIICSTYPLMCIIKNIQLFWYTFGEVCKENNLHTCMCEDVAVVACHCKGQVHISNVGFVCLNTICIMFLNKINT